MSATLPSSASSPAVRPARPAFFWLVLALGLLLAAVFGAGTLVLLRYGGERGRLGWQTMETPAGVVVRAVDVGGPADGRLRAGDRIVAVGGDRRVNEPSLHWLLARVRPGGSYTLRVARAEGEQDVSLEAGTQRTPRWLGTFAVRLVVALVLCSTGLAVGLLRPHKKVARLYSLAVLMSAPVFFANPLLLSLLDSGVVGMPEALVVWLARIHSPFHGAVGFHFAVEFPGRVPPSRALRAWRWIFYAWAAVICAFYNVAYYFVRRGPGPRGRGDLGASRALARALQPGLPLRPRHLLRHPRRDHPERARAGDRPTSGAGWAG